MKVVAHCYRGDEPFSLVAIRIRTGRRHQIRIHAAHLGHPTVCDGKYTPAATFARDKEWCERNFLHRYRLAFADGEGELREAMCPLPGDLLDALRALHPATRQSATAVQEWLEGRGHRDWDSYTPLGDASNEGQGERRA